MEHSLLIMTPYETLVQSGLLILRVLAGAFMLTHGWPKLKNFSAYAQKFPSVAGFSSKTSLSICILAEFFCAILVILGLVTRLAALLLVANMLVALFKVHRNDPFAKRELPLLYGTIFLVLILTGAGMFSLDYLLGIR